MINSIALGLDLGLDDIEVGHDGVTRYIAIGDIVVKLSKSEAEKLRVNLYCVVDFEPGQES